MKSTKKKKLDFGSIKKAAELKFSQIKERSLSRKDKVNFTKIDRTRSGGFS